MGRITRVGVLAALVAALAYWSHSPFGRWEE